MADESLADPFDRRNAGAMGFFDRFVTKSGEQERDRWWMRTDGVDEPPPDDYDEAAEQRHFDEAAARGADYDSRAGYHRSTTARTSSTAARFSTTTTKTTSHCARGTLFAPPRPRPGSVGVATGCARSRAGQ
jgi:hypothetical protein